MELIEFRNNMGLISIDAFKWEGIYSTGDFPLFDYDVGLLSVGIYRSTNKKGWMVGFTISCIDDGLWMAYEVDYKLTKEESEQKLDQLALDFLTFMESNYGFKLPPEKELNKFLSKYGLWGQIS